MRLFIVFLITLVNLVSWPTAWANPEVTIKKSHPKICVVLSGGGARGFAHIGVLKYLEEQRIPIDCIAGTSMGAVVGGLYASGMPANEIEKRLNGINLNNVALDIVDRRELPETLREDDYNYTIGGTFGLSKEGVTLPLGAVQANQFLEILQNWTSHLPPDITFDQLPIPFRSVATDLETGEMVVFSSGPISTAIRASMSAPGVFAPIEYEGRLLTDGGLVRNLPIDIAREMGADIVIAVNIGTPLLPRDSLNNFFNISQQMINILTEQNVNEQKKLLTSSDILIDADLGTIRFLDFKRAQEALTIGYQSAEKVHNQLATLALSPDSYLARLKERPDPNLPPIKIAFVDVESNGKIPAEDIRRQLDILIGSTYSAAEINKRITPLINSGQYETVTHTVIERDGEYGVEIDATELRWGPNFLRFGLELTTGYNGMSGFELQVGHRLPWINASGLEWRNDLRIGTIYEIRSELRQPIMNREGIYIAPYVDASLNSFSLYENNDRIVDYSLQTTQLGLDLGVPLGAYGEKGEIRTGLFATNYHLRPKLGGVITILPDGEQVLTSLSSLKQDELAFHSRFIIDQLDEPYFPSAGYQIGGEFIAGINRNSGNKPDATLHSDFREFHQVTLNGKWAKSDGNNSLNLSMQAGVRSQSGPAIPGIGLSLGGFQQLTAYQPEQFFGNYLLYGNATYLFRAINFDMFGQAIFVGTSLEIGNASDNRSDLALANLKKSFSIFAGAKTIMGPVYFGIAAAPAGAFNLFLQLGRQ
jgi:NTE family protein